MTLPKAVDLDRVPNECAALLLDSLDRFSDTVDAIEAITMPDTINEFGGERIHAALFIVLTAVREEILQAEQNIRVNMAKEVRHNVDKEGMPE